MPPPGAPLSDWLAWLESLSPTGINLGLERVQLVLERLDMPRPANVFLIAGTNGKGSSVAMTDALLQAAGLRTGAYTSPHIHRFNERIQVNGIEVNDAKIIAALERVEAARGDTELTYFEFATLAAIVVFAAADLDAWVLEVGLGGRLDATNAIEPTASLITNISLDHCDWLGEDVETIAVEKSGIMRRGIHTVFGHVDVPDSVKRQAEVTGAKLLLAGRDFGVQSNNGREWSWHGPSGVIDGLQRPGLAGDFQTGNAAAVLALLDAAGLASVIDAELINRVLPVVRLAGRMQRLVVDGLDGENNEWLIDVAHNAAAADALAATLATMQLPGAVFTIIGLLDDKDVAGVIGPLAEHVDYWIAMTADSDRGVPANELARQISNLTGRACLIAGSAADAVEFARRNASENDRILTTGSFYTVGPVLDHLATDSRPQT